MQFKIVRGDCLAAMQQMPDASVDSIVCDPPYELGFMGKGWDNSGIAFSVDLWREALRVLKPGGHLLAFSGSRTYHRMAVAIEDAGFEIRDQMLWLYGSGFPKSQNVSLALDKKAGAVGHLAKSFNMKGGGDRAGEFEGNGRDLSIRHTPATDAARQWEGWGTALKPAHEPICMARKPLAKGITVAANVLAHGTGALNIEACRVGTDERTYEPKGTSASAAMIRVPEHRLGKAGDEVTVSGRWPANIIHDGSAEVVALFPDSTGSGAARVLKRGDRDGEGWGMADEPGVLRDAGTGSAARFFYCAKASKADRGAENVHPTVKPTALMAYLVRLVTPPGGLVLDPFMGSGSTGKAAIREGFRFLGCELSDEYADIAQARISHELMGDLL